MFCFKKTFLYLDVLHSKVHVFLMKFFKEIDKICSTVLSLYPDQVVFVFKAIHD